MPTSPSIVSRRVVLTSTVSPSLSAISYANVSITPTVNFRDALPLPPPLPALRTLGMVMVWRPATSTWSTSISESAVARCGHLQRIQKINFSEESSDNNTKKHAPIDHSLSSVDKSALVQTDESLCDSVAVSVIQRVNATAPVHTGTEQRQLTLNPATRPSLPLVRFVDERGTSNVVARKATRRHQVSLNDALRCNTSVIESRDPADGIAAHATVPCHCVLNRNGQSVPNVEYTRYVRRWEHHRERCAVRRHVCFSGRFEGVDALPKRTHARLDRARIERRRGRPRVPRNNRWLHFCFQFFYSFNPYTVLIH